MISTEPVNIRERKGSTYYIVSGDKIDTVDISKTNASNNYLLATINFQLFLREAPQGSDRILGADQNLNLVIINSFNGLIDILIDWGEVSIKNDMSKQIGETKYICLLKRFAGKFFILDFSK